MPDKKLIFQVRTIFLRSKEMIVVLSLFMFSIVAAMIWLMAGNVSALYDDAALGALDVPLKFSLASFVVFSFQFSKIMCTSAVLIYITKSFLFRQMFF